MWSVFYVLSKLPKIWIISFHFDKYEWSKTIFKSSSNCHVSWDTLYLSNLIDVVKFFNSIRDLLMLFSWYTRLGFAVKYRTFWSTDITSTGRIRKLWENFVIDLFLPKKCLYKSRAMLHRQLFQERNYKICPISFRSGVSS